MTKTDWRSEFKKQHGIDLSEMNTGYLEPIELIAFIKQTRIEAQIEVLEKVWAGNWREGIHGAVEEELETLKQK